MTKACPLKYLLCYLDAKALAEFENLATEFSKPTTHDLENFATERFTYRLNSFHSVFLRLSDVIWHGGNTNNYRYAIVDLFDVLLSNMEGTERLLVQNPSVPLLVIRS